MNLAIFDVDGTLTCTNEIDAQSYVRAMREEFGLDAAGLDWHDYTFVTDIGVTNQMFEEHFGRLPSAAEVARLQRCLLRLLEEARASSAAAFAAVPGADQIIDWLRDRNDWTVGIATGCWQASAQMKLRAAGISIDGVAAAFCEDGHAREDIVRAAVERARVAAGVVEFERIVSVGDGLWDISTAARLALAFVGVAVDGREERLRRRGATHVVRDFCDRDEMLRSLHEAGVPRMNPGI